MTNKGLAVAKAKQDLRFFAKRILNMKDINEQTHGEIISLLQDNQQKRKLINVPRGCLKSSLACVAYPLWLLINNPDLRILIDSELYTNSATFLREIKGHAKSKIFLYLFGDIEGSTWTESEIIIKSRRKVLKEASITVGGIGTTKVGQHFDVIIGDDYNSPNNTNTIENAAKVVSHYRYNISILEPDGIYVVIGTRYHQNDLIGHLLENEETNVWAACGQTEQHLNQEIGHKRDQPPKI